MKTALITGVAGQTGSYLAEYLLSLGYKVIGMIRRSSSSAGLWRLKRVVNNPNFELVQGDVIDYNCILNLITKYWPDEIYNLAAQSHVGTSFTQPSYTTQVTYLGCLNILEALRYLIQNQELHDRYKFPKLYQASSSEMFGDSVDRLWISPFDSATGKTIDGRGFKDVSYEEIQTYCDKRQSETTKFNPQSPYAIAKLAAHHAVRLYRESYGLHASCGILFNHESPRRGEEFVTKKIVNYIRYVRDNLCFRTENDGFTYIDYTKGYKKLRLGNLDASRDWGYAKDYIEGIYLMLQQEKPDDYVLATGETHTVKEFLTEAFLNIDIKDWSGLVEIDQNLIRPMEVPYLRGDFSKAKKELGWTPKTSFKQLVKLMINEET